MMLENMERHQLQTLMLLGDGTDSKGDPDSTLDFYTKIQVWGRMVRIPSSTHQGASKKMMMMMNKG
jgi:hypothetical protein